MFVWAPHLRLGGARAGANCRIINLAAVLAASAMVFAPSAPRAQPAEAIASVPAALADASPPWTNRRAKLSAVGDRLRARAIRHNAGCSEVPADNAALVQSCSQEQAQVNADIAAYRREVEAFNSDLATSIAPTLVRIGTAAAVRGDVFMQGPDGVKRRVVSGGPLDHNGRLTTGPTGHLQMLLEDETVTTLGPNAEVVLNSFVYNPATGKGGVVAQVVRGAFRLVTGRIARVDPDRIRVKVNNIATIGIRGTDLEVDVASDNSAVVKLYSGAAVITPINGGAPTPLEAGRMLMLANDGTPGPSEPIK